MGQYTTPLEPRFIKEWRQVMSEKVTLEVFTDYV
jgi:hypothetical protein